MIAKNETLSAWVKLVLIAAFTVGLLALGVLIGGAQAAPVLANPNFETGFRNVNGIGELTVANDWQPWYVEGPQHRPEYKEEKKGEGASRVYQGQSAQKQFTTFSSQDGGIYQRVSVTPGKWYEFSCYAYVWSNNQENVNVSEKPGKYSVLVGINPWGDTRATYRTTIWGRECLECYDKWVQVTVVAEAWSDAITVFTRGEAIWGVKHNDSYWDACTIREADWSGGTPPPPTPAATSTPGPGVDYDLIRQIIRSELDATRLGQ